MKLFSTPIKILSADYPVRTLDAITDVRLVPIADVVASMYFSYSYANNLTEKKGAFMREIVVEPYDEKWPAMFNAENFLLQALLGDVARKIHHIGSTSVPGLSAKPVIDILLEVADINQLDKCNSAMVDAGYVARGENGIAGRRYFIKGGISVAIKCMRFQ